MTVLPLSGKSGVMIYQSQVELPVYSFLITGSQARPTYRTANSENFPRRTSATLNEIIVIRGVQPVPPFFQFTLEPDGLFLFNIGWNELALGKRKLITIQALMQEFRIEYNYFSSPLPSFIWTATFLGSSGTPIIQTQDITSFVDVILCSDKLCNKTITTTDAQLNSGFVQHVKKATLIYNIERNSYATSNSFKHIVGNTGVKDRKIELDIEGDFDYWWNNLLIADTRHDYSFFYGFGASEKWSYPKMKITDVGNFIVNIQTGELISATVQLGAAYG